MAKAKKKAAKKAKGKSGSNGSTSASSAKARIETKLSTKMIIGKVVFPEDAQDDEEIDLYTVYGELTGIKTGESSFGEYIALTGRVRAVRASDGKVFQALKCFLPRVATEIAVDTLAKIDKAKAEAVARGETASDAGLEFALKIGARKDSSINVGYRYTCEPILQEQSDLFSRLEGQLALPNPATAG